MHERHFKSWTLSIEWINRSPRRYERVFQPGSFQDAFMLKWATKADPPVGMLSWVCNLHVSLNIKTTAETLSETVTSALPGMKELRRLSEQRSKTDSIHSTPSSVIEAGVVLYECEDGPLYDALFDFRSDARYFQRTKTLVVSLPSYKIVGLLSPPHTPSFKFRRFRNKITLTGVSCQTIVNSI